MEVSKVKTGSALFFFILIIYGGFNVVMPHCFKYKECGECTRHRTWTGGSCRWCPLDNACHAGWSPKNPCLRRQNVKNPSSCMQRVSNRSKYNPQDAYNLALFSAIAYSDEPDKCLDTIFGHGAYFVESVVSADCETFLFDYKKCLALIAVSEYRKEIIVAYRGTRGYKQVFDEIISMIAIPKVRSSVGGKTQSYFQRVHELLYNGVRTALEDMLQKYQGYKVKLTGHSLGGAVASITSAVLSQDNVVKADNVYLYTFGMPRVGNKIYAEAHDKLVKNSWRVVRDGDLITNVPRCMLPPCSIFNGPYHHGRKVLYKGDSMSLDSQFIVCKGSDDSNSKCRKRRGKRGVFVDNMFETHKHYFGIPIGTYCIDTILKNNSSMLQSGPYAADTK